MSSRDGAAGRYGASGASGRRGAAVAPVPVDPDLVIRDGYTVTTLAETLATRPVTLSDLVNFRPTSGINGMEPNGWMIVGLHTNFYAQTGTHVQSGQLLGQPASVRFTPVRYTWSYGDGMIATLRTPGATWAAQGLREFDPTPTSHVYATAGTYTIDLTIGFAAEYRFGSTQWTPISGLVSVPANRLTVAAGDAKTVLVHRECTISASGPGC